MARVAAFLIMIDGLLSAALGRGFVRWLRARAPQHLRFLFSPFLLIPQPLLRAGALLQALGGAYLLASRPAGGGK